MTPDLLTVSNLSVRFIRPDGLVVHAVDEISFSVPGGDSFGLVGESGSGKSTVARAVVRLIEPTSGEIRYDKTRITGLKERRLRGIRRDIQIVFQDPLASLNPVMTVGDAVLDGLAIHRQGSPAERKERVEKMLADVGLGRELLDVLPVELSGGQQQRVLLARSLILNPRLLILDEPTSALDVSVQAQIIALLLHLREYHHLTYIFISHNLAVVEKICDSVGVMYLGRLVETGPVSQVFTEPAHPYTDELLRAIPHLDPDRRTGQAGLPGEIPSPLSPPPGCRFHTRCRFAESICRTEAPRLRPFRGQRRQVACHLNLPRRKS